MKNKDELRTLISVQNSGKRIAPMQLVEKSPLAAAAISKLFKPDNTTVVKHDSDGNREIEISNQSGLLNISNDSAQKTQDNENVTQLFPELKHAIDILVNSVMAPKDLNSTDITFSVNTNLKVFPLASKLLPIIEEKLSNDFKLKEMLPEMLFDCLGRSGAYPMIVIPESSVDEMINGKRFISTESLIESFGNQLTGPKSLGFLGDSDYLKKDATKPIKEKTVSIENFINTYGFDKKTATESKVFFRVGDNDIDSFISVSDNIDLIKFPSIVEHHRSISVNALIGNKFKGSSFNFAHESFNVNPYGSRDITDQQLTQLLYKGQQTNNIVTRRVKTTNDLTRDTIGAPVVKHLPTESVIPVCLSGDKTRHIAYFVLLDSIGNPLSKDAANTVFDDFKRNQGAMAGGSRNLASSMLQRTADAFQTSCDAVTYDQMQKTAVDIIEADFLARLRNGIYGEDVALVNNPIFYDILLARLFRQQHTQVLFIPNELMTYFHNDLRENGTGKTLLEDSLVINSLRSVLMFANVNRSVINSIGKTEVELNVDESDPHKAKTLQVAMHQVLATRVGQALPASISPVDVNKFLKTAGVNFVIGQVPGLPTTSIKLNETATNYIKPDTELTEQLDKKAILATGVPPELVANNDIEFATNIVANNIRLNKQIIQIQDQMQPLISKFARCFCLNHGNIRVVIEKIIKDNINILTQTKTPDETIESYKDNEDILVTLLTQEFLSNIQVNFSRPDTITLKNQMEAFDEYEQALDKAIKYFISEDLFSESTSGEELAAQVALVQNAVKAYYIREWLVKNTIMPELADLTTTDEDGKPNINIFEASSNHANNITKALGDFVKRTVPVAQSAQNDVNVVTGGQELGGGASVGSSSSSSDSGSDDEGSMDENTDEDGGDSLDGMPPMPSFDDY